MQFLLSDRALRDYLALSQELKRLVDKQLSFLMENLTHPSLRAKKYDEVKDIWQARVNRSYRFYFQIEGNTYHILTILKHPK